MRAASSLLAVGGFLLVGAQAIMATALFWTSLRAKSAMDGVDDEVWASVQERIDEKKLVAVSSDHWLFPTLCLAKRLEHTAAFHTLHNAETMSTMVLETLHLLSLLPALKHERLGGKDVQVTSERVVLLASIFSHELTDYEPLLVELTLAHCLHEWTSSRNGKAVNDAAAFDAFLMAELQSEQAKTWFSCQFVIDTIDLLGLSRYFYEEKLSAQDKPLRDLISISISANEFDCDKFKSEILLGLALKQNKTAADAWAAWVDREIKTTGSVRRHRKTPTSLAVLSDLMINPTHFEPDKHAYFPFGMQLKGIGSKSFGDLSGVINRKSESQEDGDDDVMERGFVYDGVHTRISDSAPPDVQQSSNTA